MVDDASAREQELELEESLRGAQKVQRRLGALFLHFPKGVKRYSVLSRGAQTITFATLEAVPCARKLWS